MTTTPSDPTTARPGHHPSLNWSNRGEVISHRVELVMSDRATDPQTPQPTVRANGVELGVETFGRDDNPLVLLAGGTTMLSWPDSVCEQLAAGGRRVVRYDLRDRGASTTLDPEAPGVWSA